MIIDDLRPTQLVPDVCRSICSENDARGPCASNSGSLIIVRHIGAILGRLRVSKNLRLGFFRFYQILDSLKSRARWKIYGQAKQRTACAGCAQHNLRFFELLTESLSFSSLCPDCVYDVWFGSCVDFQTNEKKYFEKFLIENFRKISILLFFAVFCSEERVNASWSVFWLINMSYRIKWMRGFPWTFLK